jgi:hypothetical protein
LTAINIPRAWGGEKARKMLLAEEIFSMSQSLLAYQTAAISERSHFALVAFLASPQFSLLFFPFFPSAQKAGFREASRKRDPVGSVNENVVFVRLFHTYFARLLLA